MEKIIVDTDKCIGCGSCIGIAPKTFDWNDEGTSKVINDVVTDDAKNAMDCCPTGAINIKKED